MDKQKQLELVKERNANLAKTVQELRDQIEFDKNYNTASLTKAKNLIEELEQIKQEWTENIEELRIKQEQFNELIEQTKRLRSLVDKEMGQKGIPRWRRKQLFRLVDEEMKQEEKELIENKE